jgi:hypothetical protein
MELGGRVSIMKPVVLRTPQPDGTIKLQTLSLEESQRIREQFSKEFDPVTLEHRSLIEFRKKQARTSPPSQTGANPSFMTTGARKSSNS